MKSKMSNDIPPGVRVTKITRLANRGPIASSAVDTGGSFQFTLDQVPEHLELAQMYDAYSIDEVEVTFTWRQPTGVISGTAPASPVMVLTRDYDDATPPVTFEEVGAFADANLHVFSLAKNSFTVRVKPRVAMTVFRSGVTSGYSWGKSRQIIDAASVDVPHYGLKWFIQSYNSAQFPSNSVWIHAKYHLSLYASR